jgi:flagellar biogenesis protein FliO
MPLVTRTAVLAFGIAVALIAPAAAQIPGQPQPDQYQRPAQARRQIPWTGGGTTTNPAEPRLLPTAYQTPVTAGESVPNPITPASAQQPISQPVPLPRQGAAAANPFGGKDFSPLATGAASLGIVLGLFLLVVWSVRRGTPKGGGLVPSEAVEVLGRAAIGGKQNVHLVRCGNKIVLVNVSATSVETLTEISDPGEVERLQEICRHSTSPVSAVQQLLGRFGAVQQPATLAATRPDQVDFRHLEAGSYPRA